MRLKYKLRILQVCASDKKSFKRKLYRDVEI